MKPLIIESKSRILLETNSNEFLPAKEAVTPFLELVKALNFFNIYSISHLSLWNGFVEGFNYKKIKNIFNAYSKFPLPEKVMDFIKESFENFNVVRIKNYDEKYDLIESHEHNKLLYALDNLEDDLRKKIIINQNQILLPCDARGVFKSNMINLGYPVNDLIEFMDGDPLEIKIKPEKLKLRKYQEDAKKAFLNSSKYSKGSMGLVVLPCGAGKTIVGISILASLQMTAMIITPNVIALRQWKKELLDKTNIREEDIGEYSGVVKEIKKITLTTYQILTYRNNRDSDFHHLFLFQKKNWGIIIYDEIHMLPAKVFRYVSSVQSKRRLGLTATLVREDGNEKQVFSLVGPKRYDIFWKDLEKADYLAKVNCFEVKVNLPADLMKIYYQSKSEKEKYKIASINYRKNEIIRKIISFFKGYQIIIIGYFIEQLEQFQKEFNVPLLMGKTNYLERQKAYKDFNDKKINMIIASKIANFAVDLPSAEVALQVSGTFGSRQEEAQRLGRIIRPKKDKDNQAFFITLVTQFTQEEFLCQNRKGFLISQGYQYQIKKEDELNFFNSS